MRPNFATWLTVALATALSGGFLGASPASASETVRGTVTVTVDAPMDRNAHSGGMNEAGATSGSEPAGNQHCSASPEADDTDRELNLGRSAAESRLAFGGRGCTFRRLTDIVFVEAVFDPD